MIDESKTEEIKEFSKDLLEGFYTKSGETIQQAFARACVAWADDEAHAQRLYDACSSGHFMWSSPCLANAPLPNEAIIGQPISCYLPYIGDTIPSLLLGKLELSILSVMGGGLGQFYDVRYASQKSPGPIPFICEADASILAWKQGTTRRGALAAWLNSNHPSALEFMNIRTPTGDSNRKAENIHIGFAIDDKLMEGIRDGAETYDLVDPASGRVVQQVNPKTYFGDMVRVRGRTGEPFMYFKDTAQEALPQSQKDLGLETHASNLCFVGDTRVFVADGRKPIKISKLARESNGVQKFKVWSSRVIGGSSSPEMRDAVANITGRRATIKLTLSNGGTFRCTPDHEIFTNQGRKIQAKDSINKYLDSKRMSNGQLIVMNQDLKVVDIDFTPIVEDIFCLTVEENHNFYISTKENSSFNHDGVLVKNCTEITLPANETRTPVCCLASLNAEKREEWSPTLVRDLTRALDNVLTRFIDTVEDIQYRYPEHDRELLRLAVKKVKYSAMRERSIGIGVMGFHYALQKRNLSFACQGARDFNNELFSYIKSEALAETYLLGAQRGCAPDAEGDGHSHSGRRNMHLLANAPNSNNSDMLATSATTEPVYSNIYTKESRIGLFEIRNPYLEAVLEKMGRNTDDVWDRIVASEGSVKDLEFFDDHTKKVFATAFETDMYDVIRLAADRQPKICQAQSINLFFKPGSDINYVYGVHYNAWLWGLKSLYYYRTHTEVKVERLGSKIVTERLKDAESIIYGTATCSECKNAKRLMEEMNIRFKYVDLQEVGKTAAEVTGDPSIRSVPQIFINGKWIGGIKELRAQHRKYYDDILNSSNPINSQDDADCIYCQG